MKRADFATLVLLSALWGASYIFMKLGVVEFGPIAFAGLRALVAAALLLPLLVWRYGLKELRTHWWPIALVGLTNSALPFVLYSYAASSIQAGLSSIFSAATPLYTAAIAWAWLRERPKRSRIVGLAIGFTGVVWLTAESTGLSGGAPHGRPVAACVLATLLYGFSANFARRHLNGVPALVSTAGGQLAAAIALAVPSVVTWPAAQPSLHAWAALLILAIACTAFAYVIFFRLIANVGAPRAMTVGFLIPVFGLAWGWLFLGETFSWIEGICCAVIFAGTALTADLVGIRSFWKRRLLAAPVDTLAAEISSP